jgi:A1 cistron-splicing factor AAR2
MSIIRLQNIPPGSQVGLDLHSWQSGPNFRGIRDVPEGLHCLHVTIANVSLTKYAVWLSTCPGQSASYAWQAIEQSLIRQDSPNDLHLGEEMFFVSCPSEPDKQYTAISRHLNADTVRRFVPLGTVVTSTSTSNTETLAEELKKLDASLSASAADRILQFTTVDLKRSWRPGAVGRELTEQSLDKSWLLRSTIQCCGSQAGFLAEFEFCFLSVLLYGSLAACDQYNILLLLVANAKSALLTEQAFFEDFLALLHVSWISFAFGLTK